ncbi:hypothetical protein PANT_14c00083 [Moesziomyces antarcticus T-34]|uniref:Uncharacterized protein n=1 Tax=Pseudozyma antarctica (strain T-34) TaxID=1151754 RepID=M9M489_PSEA3|nr:hypothetical protein PANT_14c00083 [Moesziomyces antarcticus T-34]
MFLFACFLLFAVGALAGGSSSRPSPDVVRSYRDLHRGLLEPINLYNPQPQTVAPLGPPWRGRNKLANMQNYIRNVYNHEAYIDPEAGAALTRLRGNMQWIINHPNDPRIKDYQRGLVAVMEEASAQAKHDMQNGLHPVNVRAQHLDPIRSLSNKVNGVVDLFGQGRSELMSSHLEQADRDRFAKAFEVLFSEKHLLSSATRLATTVPRLQ